MSALSPAAQQLASHFIDVCRVAYDPRTTNDERHRAIASMEAMFQPPPRSQCSHDVSSALLAIAFHPNSASPEACSAALGQLSSLLRRGVLPPQAVPLASLISAIAQQGMAVPRIVLAGWCQTAAVAAVMGGWLGEGGCENWLDLVCPTDLHQSPATLMALECFVAACGDESTELEHVGHEARHAIRRAFAKAAPELLRRVVATAGQLFHRYNGVGRSVDGRGAADTTPLNEERSLLRCVSIVQPLLSSTGVAQQNGTGGVQTWYACYVHDFIAALAASSAPRLRHAAFAIVCSLTEVNSFKTATDDTTYAFIRHMVGMAEAHVEGLLLVLQQLTQILSEQGVSPLTHELLERLTEGDGLDVLRLLLDALCALGPPLSQRLFPVVCPCFNKVLQLPSVAFGTAVFEYYAALGSPPAPGQEPWSPSPSSSSDPTPPFSPGMLLRQISQLCMKHVSNPSAARAAPQGGPLTSPADSSELARYRLVAQHFSAKQFSSLGDYDQGFSNLRSTASHTLQWLTRTRTAEIIEASAQFLLSLPTPTSSDPRTHFGHVTQLSDTFVRWEVASFIMEQVNDTVCSVRRDAASGVGHGASPSTERATAVAQLADPTAISTMLVHMSARGTPPDATLLPIFLNIHASFWPVANPVAHLQSTLEMLLHVTQLKSTAAAGRGEPPVVVGASTGEHASQSTPWVNTNDQDLLAARKRGWTLLIRLASDYAADTAAGRVLGGPLPAAFIERVQTLQMRNEVLHSEQQFLFESCVAFAGAVPDSAHRDQLLERLLGQRLESLAHLLDTHTCTGNLLAQLLCARSATLREARAALKDGVLVLAATLRRCPSSPFITHRMQHEMLPRLGSAALSLLSFEAFLDPEYRAILDLDEADVDSLQVGNRRAPIDRRSDLHSARTSLTYIRQGIYQSIGLAMSHYGSTPQFVPALCDLLSRSRGQSLHAFRSLVEQCLFPAVIAFPPLAANVFPVIGHFLRDYLNVPNRSDRDDIAACKQASFFVRDAVRILKTVLVPQKVPGTAGQVAVIATAAAPAAGAGQRSYDAERFTGVLQSAVPRATETAIDFFTSVVLTGLSGGTTTNAVRDLFSIFEAAASHGALALEILPSAISSFGVVVKITVTHPRVTEKDRDAIVWSLYDWYMRAFPSSRAALTALGASDGQIAGLTDAMTATSRNDIRRRKFRECVDALSKLAFGAPPALPVR